MSLEEVLIQRYANPALPALADAFLLQYFFPISSLLLQFSTSTLFLWGLLDQSAHSEEIGELACLCVSKNYLLRSASPQKVD